MSHTRWDITHPVGCPDYEPPEDETVDDSAQTQCDNLTLDSIRCLLPLCPMPNATDSPLKFNESMYSFVLQDDDVILPVEVGRLAKFSCIDECKLHLM